MSDVTRILQSIDTGESRDCGAAEELLPLVYNELRRLAAVKMRRESPGHTLQPTALVHEAWIRLVKQDQQSYNDRQHFFRVAAEAMRRILVDRARRKNSQKRGGGLPPLDIEKLDLPIAVDDDSILLVDNALEQLTRHDPQKAEIVKLRYFAGLSHQEIANLLGITERTVVRYWTYARAWLYDVIEQELLQTNSRPR